MKSDSLYIAARERHAGSLLVSLGLMSILRQQYEKIAFFRPLAIHANDEDCQYMKETFDLEMPINRMVGMTIAEATLLVSQNKKHELFERLINTYQQLQKEHDFVMVHGMDLSRHALGIDFDINTELSNHFNAPFVAVLNANEKTQSDIEKEVEMEINRSKQSGVSLFAIFVNQVMHEIHPETCQILTETWPVPVFYLPYMQDLNTPTVKEVNQALGGTLILNHDAPLSRLVKRPTVAAMTVENYLSRVKEGDLIIVPGDRTDILTASILSIYSRNFPNIAGVFLTGGLVPPQVIMDLLNGSQATDIPVILVESDTYPTAMKAHAVRAHLFSENEGKTHLALGLFDQFVKKDCLLPKFVTSKKSVTTPIMFEYSLFERAKQQLKTIVLPESNDERILRACEILLRRQVIKPILLGKADEILQQCNLLGINIDGATIIDPTTSQWQDEFINDYYQMRQHKGVTLDIARDSMAHVSYFATMMVQKGYADGMVSGATHTTADTVRPALQIIKTQPGISLVSSVFFMCFKTRVLVYGDCAVNQNPNAEQLSEIAISSAQTAQQFGITPKVALLSYSTGESGQGDEVVKVRTAAKLAHQKRPDLAIEGPLQYDAAIDAEVARQKMPNSIVAGQATVFVFPDLNTGNNTYKAVQRASGAIAIGPVLQGLNKPVNDLSRGCTVDDIVNTVAITAIQAQQMETNT